MKRHLQVDHNLLQRNTEDQITTMVKTTTKWIHKTLHAQIRFNKYTTKSATLMGISMKTYKSQAQSNVLNFKELLVFDRTLVMAARAAFGDKWRLQPGRK